MRTNGNMRQRLAAHGFHHEHTGGNCTAFVCYTPHAEFFLVLTHRGDPMSLAPGRSRDAAVIGRVPLVDGVPVAEQWSEVWRGRVSALLDDLDAAPSDWLGLGDRRGPEYQAKAPPGWPGTITPEDPQCP